MGRPNLPGVSRLILHPGIARVRFFSAIQDIGPPAAVLNDSAGRAGAGVRGVPPPGGPVVAFGARLPAAGDARKWRAELCHPELGENVDTRHQNERRMCRAAGQNGSRGADEDRSEMI